MQELSLTGAEVFLELPGRISRWKQFLKQTNWRNLRNMQQLTSNAPPKGVVKTLTLIAGKEEVQQQKLSAVALAEQLGMEFPQQGLPVVMDDGEPVAVHAEDLVNPNSFFLTDYSGQMVTVQPMMGG